MSIFIYGIFFYLYVHFYFSYIRREKREEKAMAMTMIMTMTVVGWGVSMGTRCVIIYQLLWRWGRLIIVIIGVIIILLWGEFEPESGMTWNKIDDDNGDDCTIKKKRKKIMWKELWFIPFIQSHLILVNFLSIIYCDYPRYLTCTFVDVLISTAIFIFYFLRRKEHFRTANISLYHSLLFQYFAIPRTT